jgi:hypothetical protein
VYEGEGARVTAKATGVSLHLTVIFKCPVEQMTPDKRVIHISTYAERLASNAYTAAPTNASNFTANELGALE